VAHSRLRRGIVQLAGAVLVLVGSSGVARAQPSGGCSVAGPLGFGITAGRSSPYFDLARELADGGQSTSIQVRSGGLVGGRLDVPIAGPWRARVEASRANWRVERQIYGEGFQVVGSDTAGHVEARQLVGMVGRQGGRRPACGYVLAGGGIYSLSYQDASLRRPGFALAAGIEVATGDHGAIQVDVQLNIIDTQSRPPVSGSAALAASLTAGWSFRF